MAPRPETSQIKTLGWLLHGAGAVSLCIGVGIFYATFFASLDALRIRNLTRQAALEGALGNAEQIRSQNRRLVQLLDDIERRAQQTRARIPSEPFETEFFEQMTRAAQAVELTIHDYRRGEIKSDDRITQMEIHLVGKGSYASLCRFLDQLAHLPRLIKVQGLTVRAPENSQEYPVDLWLVLYYDPTPPVAHVSRVQPLADASRVTRPLTNAPGSHHG